MAMVQKQLENHNSGVKVVDDRRVTSLKNRLQSYKGQIYDATRTLSDEVCLLWCLRSIVFLWSRWLRERKKCRHAIFARCLTFTSNLHNIFAQRKLKQSSIGMLNFRATLGCIDCDRQGKKISYLFQCNYACQKSIQRNGRSSDFDLGARIDHQIEIFFINVPHWNSYWVRMNWVYYRSWLETIWNQTSSTSRVNATAILYPIFGRLMQQL